MSWEVWDNWSDPQARAAERRAQEELYAGWQSSSTNCNNQEDCASGFACVGGICTQKPVQESTTGSSGCDGLGGGGCDVEISQGMTWLEATQKGIYWENGVGTTGYNFVPVYAADGCTVTGCTLEQCGGGFGCTGPVYGVPGAGGSISWGCNPPPEKICTEFCTAFNAANGYEPAGCFGQGCDACTYCNVFTGDRSGVCEEIGYGGPCFCDSKYTQTCYKCNQDGSTTYVPETCSQCVDIQNYECDGCKKTYDVKCCYTLKELENGLSAVNRCENYIAEECAKECEKPDATPDPCEGTCVSKTLCQTGTCPDLPANQPSKRNVATGCIEANGEGCLLYNECDLSDVPDSCKECDCNCSDDCGYCQVCDEATGSCVTDPNDYNCTSINAISTWEFGPMTIRSKINKGQCCFLSCTINNNPGEIVFTGRIVDSNGAGPTPHYVKKSSGWGVRFGWNCTDGNGDCLCGPGFCGGDGIGFGFVAQYDVFDANGNFIGLIEGLVRTNAVCSLIEPEVFGDPTPYLVSYTPV